MMTSIEQRQMALGYGLGWGFYMAYPYPDGDINIYNRFYIHRNYYPEGRLKDFMPFFAGGI